MPQSGSSGLLNDPTELQEVTSAFSKARVLSTWLEGSPPIVQFTSSAAIVGRDNWMAAILEFSIDRGVWPSQSR